MPDFQREFERQELTCGSCGITNRIAVWKRLASEIHAPFSITRVKKTTQYTCPRCYVRGKGPQ